MNLSTFDSKPPEIVFDGKLNASVVPPDQLKQAEDLVGKCSEFMSSKFYFKLARTRKNCSSNRKILYALYTTKSSFSDDSSAAKIHKLMNFPYP